MEHHSYQDPQRPNIPASSQGELNSGAQSPSQGTRRSQVSKSQPIVFMNFLMSILLFSTLAMGAALYYGKITYEQAGPLKADTTFEVRNGAGLKSIADSLQAEGLITNAFIFSRASQAILAGDTLKAGEYEIKAGASMREIMEKLRSGRSVLYSFTAPEGLTVFQIFERLKRHEDLVGALPEELPAEGSLLPNTYNFARGTTRQDIIDQMTNAQTQAVQRLWDRRVEGLPIETKEEMVILASIVEKETGKADERPQVAGVFINRLNKGMRLQSDPTIIYGIFGGEGKPSDRPIYRSDIDRKTEYNTYQIDGLPPTPIANPGLLAMEAVINPSKTDDLFFVADGTGGHAFAKTLREHNKNVAAWRKIEAQRKKQAQDATRAE